MVSSRVGGNRVVEPPYSNGDIGLEIVPQRSFVELIRAYAAGTLAFPTATCACASIEADFLLIYYNNGGSMKA